MKLQDAIKAALEKCAGHAQADERARALVAMHEMEVNILIAAGTDLNATLDLIEDARWNLWCGLLELIPELQDAAALMVEGSADLAQAVTHTTEPVRAGRHKGDPARLKFERDLAREHALVLEGHIRKFSELWKAVGIFGFACRDQGRVPELLAMTDLFGRMMEQK